MKMKLFLLLLVSMILAGPVSGATLSVSYDNTYTVSNFDVAGFGLQNYSDQLTFSSGSTSVSSDTFTRVPVPAAAWLFMSGLAGLIGIARRKKPRQTRHA